MRGMAGMGLVALLLLGACGDDDGAGASATDASESTEVDHSEHDATAETVADARRIEVVASSLTFTPSRIEVDAGEDVTIEFTAEDLEHDFVIDELSLHVAAEAGSTEEIGLRADEAGEFTFYCSVPGHREAGMEGTLVVGDG